MAILLALKFLTSLPIPAPDDVTPKMMGRAAAFYPLVGAILGCLLLGADLLLGLVLPLGLRSALLLALWVALTGGLHLDGYLDCCDGLLAPRPPEERMEILRDTRMGAFALAGGMLLLLVKYAALASLQGPARFALLVGAPILSRWAMTYALIVYPYARSGPGLGVLVKAGTGRRELLVASLLALAALIAAWGWAGLAALPLTWGWTALLAAWIRSRIPGLTGDTYGAINEVVEVAWLIVGVVLAGRV